MRKRGGSQLSQVLLWTGLLLFGGLPLPPAARAESEPQTNPHLLQPKTQSVTVFKNGLGFFIREADVELRDGWCAASRIPPATFGTLAIYAVDDNAHVDIVGAGPGEMIGFDGVDEADDEQTIRRRLEPLIGLKMRLHYRRRGQKRDASGALLSLGPEFAVLDNGSDILAVPVAGVFKCQLLDLPMRIHVAADKEDAEPPAKARIGIAHLQKGITWIPDYTLRILDDDTAELVCRGTLVNEAEDLIHCDVNFVVGVPHFVHTDRFAPLALGRTMRAVASQLPLHPNVSNAIMNRAQIVATIQRAEPVIETRVAAEEPRDLSAMVQGLPMSVGQSKDYTVYTKRDLSVRKGEKALVTLFRARIRYGHIYRWTTTGRLEHFFVLHNGAASAWTIGPCLGIEGNRPITEDLLKYTPVGGKAELKVSMAVNISHGVREEEVERKLKAHSPSHNYFLDLVNLRGVVTLRNHEPQAVRIVVTAPVSGKPLEASDSGSVNINSAKLRLLERSGTVRWDVTLEPGETKQLTFTYERYVPSK